jgi:ATP synthase protein I
MNKGYEQRVWRSAALVCGAIVAIALPTSAALAGWPGAWGALIGGTVVVIFWVVHLIVSVVSKNMDPMTTMALALMAYFGQILALAIFLIAFRGASFLDRTAFGATAISATVGWLAVEIRTFVKTRFVLGETGASEREQA